MRTKRIIVSMLVGGSLLLVGLSAAQAYNPFSTGFFQCSVYRAC